MDCDCGEGCCPSNNPLWVHKITKLEVNGKPYKDVFDIIGNRLNELIDKHNIMVENKFLEDFGISQIWSKIEKLEEFKKMIEESPEPYD